MARGIAQRQKPGWRQVRKPTPPHGRSVPGSPSARIWDAANRERNKVIAGKNRRAAEGRNAGPAAGHPGPQEESADELVKKFEAAAAESRQLTSRPSDSDLLKLYALFKQATVGEASGPAPSAGDFVGEAKHEAWLKLKGMPRETAMRNYIALVQDLKKPG